MPLARNNKITRRKISKDIEHNTINQEDLTNLYTTFHPRTQNTQLFKSPQKIYQDRHTYPDPHKKILKKFKIIQIRLTTFSEYNGIKLQITKTSLNT